MKYSPTPIFVAVAIVLAIAWVVVATSRAQVNKSATAKCALEKTKEECLDCCGRDQLITSFSAMDKECRCLDR